MARAIQAAERDIEAKRLTIASGFAKN